jgi:hypothetical protein
VVLRDLGQKEESDHFCEVWRDREPDNIYAIAASIYAKIEIRDLDAAQRLVESCIDDETECNDENDILFTAAEKVYGLTGNKKKLKKVKKALETYEELLERYMMGMDEEEDLDDPDLWELPFS